MDLITEIQNIPSRAWGMLIAFTLSALLLIFAHRHDNKGGNNELR